MKITFTKSAIYLLLIGLSSPAFAQWSSVHKQGTAPNDGCFSFSVGGKGYVGGGSSSNRLYEYDTLTNTWAERAAVPTGTTNLAFGMCFNLNNKIYVVGGDTGGFTTQRVFMYDPALDKWTQKNDFTAGKRDAACSFVLNNSAYICGGFDGAATHKDMWRYNDTTDSWVNVGDLPVDPILFLSSFVANGKGYIVGGAIGSGVTEINTTWEYDQPTNKWTKKADFPGTARQAAFTFSHQNYGYFGGGMSGYTVTYKDVWRYNANTDKWTRVQDAPSVCPAWASTFVVGNNAYLGMGATFAGSSLTGTDDFFKYTMTTPAGIETVNADNRMACYPNPATNTIYVDQNESGTYALYNVEGRQVSTGTVSGKKTIDVSELARGQYILQVNTTSGVSNTLITLH